MRSDSNVDQEDLCSASRDCDVGLVSQLLANHPFDADGTTAALSEAELDPTIFASFSSMAPTSTSFVYA
jgi:hypothetical protein